MAEYTPGPWRVIIDDDGNPLSGRPGVFAADKYDCSIVHWDGFVQTYFRSARGDKEIHANARLIAAAPELFEQLVWAETVLKCFIEGSAQLESLRAAIAKATDGEG